MNINKLIYKSIALGYPGDPTSSNLLHIQDWIIRTYNFVPVVKWNFKEKLFSSYVYPFNYDPVEFVQKIKSSSGVTAKEATDKLNAYIKSNFVVKSDKNMEMFNTPEEALYWAIIKSIEMIKKYNT